MQKSFVLRIVVAVLIAIVLYDGTVWFADNSVLQGKSALKLLDISFLVATASFISLAVAQDRPIHILLRGGVAALVAIAVVAFFHSAVTPQPDVSAYVSDFLATIVKPRFYLFTVAAMGASILTDLLSPPLKST